MLRDMYFHCYPWKTSTKVKLVTYKKKGSKWKRTRTNKYLASDNKFYDYTCTAPMHQAFEGPKIKRRKSLRLRHTQWAASIRKARWNTSLLGTFNTDNTQTLMNLTW